MTELSIHRRCVIVLTILTPGQSHVSKDRWKSHEQFDMSDKVYGKQILRWCHSVPVETFSIVINHFICIMCIVFCNIRCLISLREKKPSIQQVHFICEWRFWNWDGLKIEAVSSMQALELYLHLLVACPGQRCMADLIPLLARPQSISSYYLVARLDLDCIVVKVILELSPPWPIPSSWSYAQWWHHSTTWFSTPAEARTRVKARGAITWEILKGENHCTHPSAKKKQPSNKVAVSLQKPLYPLQLN